MGNIFGGFAFIAKRMLFVGILVGIGNAFAMVVFIEAGMTRNEGNHDSGFILVGEAEVIVKVLGFGGIEFIKDAFFVGAGMPSFFVFVSNDTFDLCHGYLVWNLIKAADIVNAIA